MKSKTLKFAQDSDGELVDLPLSMLMQTIFLGGNKGAGKTSAMKRLFEAAHAAGAQCGVVAPLGRWWSLRIGRDGRGPGLKDVFVFGGKHGDVAINATSGKSVARTVATKRIHFVLDVELMRKDDRAQFVGDFLEELWQLKKEEDASHPMVLFIDETQTIAPQKSTSKLVERMREYAGDLCREGRNHGVGMVLSAQRSANVDKDLLALVEMLIVMRTIHHLDRKVYASWVDEKGGDDDEDGAWLKRLRRLEKGQAYLYAPELNLFERVDVLLPDTYDATKTAVLGEKVAKIGKLSKLDVKKLGEELSAVVAESEANDPVKLRAQVAELTRTLAKSMANRIVEKAEKAPKPLKVDKRTLKRIERLVKEARKVMRVLQASAAGFAVGAAALDVREKLPAIRPGYSIGMTKDSATPVLVEFSAARLNKAAVGFLKQPQPAHPLEAVGAAKFEAFKNSHEKPQKLAFVAKHGTSPLESEVEARQALGKGARQILIAIAQHASGVTREQLTVMTGYKRSTRDAYLARLGQAGMIDFGTDDIQATEKGVQWLGTDYEPLPTGDLLRAHWLRTLPLGEKKVLEVLVSNYPNTLLRDVISEKTGYKRSTRDAYIQRLLTRRLVSGGTALVASRELFS